MLLTNVSKSNSELRRNKKVSSYVQYLCSMNMFEIEVIELLPQIEMVFYHYSLSTDSVMEISWRHSCQNKSNKSKREDNKHKHILGKKKKNDQHKKHNQKSCTVICFSTFFKWSPWALPCKKCYNTMGFFAGGHIATVAHFL